MSLKTTMAIFEPKFQLIVSGLKGAEGPVFNRQGELFMVAPFDHEIHRVNIKDKTTSVVCKPECNGAAGIPAGLQVDQNDGLWVADMRLGLLRVHSGTGQYEQVCQVDASGAAMQGCNDCIFDYSGTLWITAPGGEIAPTEFRHSMKENFGSIYSYKPGNKAPQKVDTGFFFCNGIAVQHDSRNVPVKLLVAETPVQTIWSYDIDNVEGTLSNKQVWAKLSGPLSIRDNTSIENDNADEDVRGPDGMDFDEDNNLLVAHFNSGSIDVFDGTSGELCTRIKCPFERVTNVHFRPESEEVYVTELDTNSLWRFPWIRKGMPQFCDLN